MVNGMYMCFICLHLYSVYHGDMCGMYNVGCVWVCVCVFVVGAMLICGVWYTCVIL